MKSNVSKGGRVPDIFLTFLKFGCFTFGGGWSIVAQIQKEYVEKKKWITDEELLDFTSVARSVPGLMIGNASVLFGYQTAGIPGALAALLGITLPPFVIMIFVTFSESSFSCASNSDKRAAFAATCALTSSASSFFPCPIKAPICLESLLRLARSSSASDCAARAFASSSITSSTSGSL